ncbi:hypothetical protein GCM10007415_34210 [Parapedobacter pyrenivorans]|uniref:Uncharacterized protein n=1 Tax=Parapedobacter pyrenivorans TaxID=1305674 RepID=A0A917MD95_9SPHI|nr:hypothetical protein [Parapedobacter pyrenivorans]GGG96154.1 hypothetical protein GCM10007415_34210 [Parapedobacter pyrenivorans]
MKRGRKRKTEVVDLQALRAELYAKHMGKIHPTIKKNLQLDGVLDEVCHHLVDLDFINKRLPYPSRGLDDFTRLYDHNTDLYIHVHYNGKQYRFDAKEVEE